MDQSSEKVCKACGFPKSREEFTKDKRNRDGLGAKCLKCFGIRQRSIYPKRRLKRTPHQKKQHNITNREWTRHSIVGLAQTIHGCKNRARQKEFGCKISKQDIINLWTEQGGLCAITKRPMLLSAPPRAFNRPSLDRIDNSKGYYVGNIRLVWHFVNQARNTFTDQEFFWCCRVVAARPVIVERQPPQLCVI